MTRLTMMNKRKAEAILENIKEGTCTLQIFASEASGVRKVDDLLSEDQLGEIEDLIADYMEQVIQDLEEQG